MAILNRRTIRGRPATIVVPREGDRMKVAWMQFTWITFTRMLFTKVAAIVQNAAYQDMRTWMLSTRILFKVTVQQNTTSRWQFAQIALHHNYIHKCAVQRRTVRLDTTNLSTFARTQVNREK